MPDPPSAAQHPTDGRIGARALSATGALVAAQLISIPLVFVGIKVITNAYGTTTYGVYATAISFTAVFSLLADFGVNAVTAREVARDPHRADEIVGTSVGLRLALCVMVVPAIIGLSFAAYPTAPPPQHFGIGLVAGALVPDAVRTVIYGFLTAKARNHWVAAFTLLQQLLFIGLTVMSVLLSAGVLAVFVAYALASSVTTIVVGFAVRRSVRTRPLIAPRRWLALLTMSASVGTIQVVNMLYLRVDSLMLSIIDGPTATGLYAIAYTVINGAAVVPGFLMTSLLPSIVTLNRRSRERLLGRAVWILAVLGALLVALLALAARNIVEVISSPDFVGAAAPLLVLGVATFFGFLNSVFGFSSVALDVHRPLVLVSVGGLALNVGLNLVLIPAGGVVGAATATLSCEVLVCVVTVVLFRSRTSLRVPVLAPVLGAATIILIALLLGEIAAGWSSGLPPVPAVLVGVAQASLAGGSVSGGLVLMQRARAARTARTADPGASALEASQVLPMSGSADVPEPSDPPSRDAGHRGRE